MADLTQDQNQRDRLIEVTLDEDLLGNVGDDIENERRIAIFDLIEENAFTMDGREGPFKLQLAISEGRLVLAITDGGEETITHVLSLQPFRRLLKDYFLVCDTYYKSIKTQSPSRIEAIDMGRRALHDEGSRILMDRLGGKIETDLGTARRLFTLICALHWKG